MTEIIRTVRVEEFDDFMQFLERCYGHSRGFFHQNHYLNIYRPAAGACACSYVLERNGKIVSHVGVFPIDIVVAGASIRVGGIGGVATLPGERGKGYMSRLLYHAIEVMRETGCLVSGLGGDRQRYGAFGWELAGLAYHLEFSHRSLDRAGIVPVSLEEKVPWEAVRTIARFQTNRVCHVRRPNLELQLRKQGLRVWVAEDGYAVARGEGWADISILELVSASGREAGMVRAILAWMLGSRATWRISAWEHESLARVMPCVSTWSATSDWVYRIINLYGLLSAFKPVLEQRAVSLRDFDVTIGISEHDRADIATIALRNKTIDLTPNCTSQPYVELDPVSAARLVLGGPSIASYKEIPQCLATLLPVPIHVPQLDYV